MNEEARTRRDHGFSGYGRLKNRGDPSSSSSSSRDDCAHPERGRARGRVTTRGLRPRADTRREREFAARETYDAGAYAAACAGLTPS